MALTQRPVLAVGVVALALTPGASWADPPVFAKPTERTDIEKVYDLIEAADRDSDVQKRLIRQVFDLSRPDVSRIMLTALNDPVRKRGEVKKYPGGARVMAVVNYTDPEKGLGWLLDHYADLNPHGRAGLVESLKFLNHVEVFALLEVLLKDRQAIDRTVERVLEANPGDSTDLRVRDVAFNMFIDLLPLSVDVPDELLEAVKPATPPGQREKRIVALEAWWRANKSAATRGLPSLGKESAVPRKIEALRLKLEADQ
jgi:hypothetical protein